MSKASQGHERVEIQDEMVVDVHALVARYDSQIAEKEEISHCQLKTEKKRTQRLVVAAKPQSKNACHPGAMNRCLDWTACCS